jgi:hypothetical protein
MWHAEHTLETSAEPERVWDCLESVSQWSDWNEDVDWAELAGPFSAGARGRVKISGQGTLNFRLDQVDANKSFVTLVSLPLAEIRRTHAQEASSMGTRLTQRIEITGPLAWFYSLTRGERLRETLAPSLRTLARKAASASAERKA